MASWTLYQVWQHRLERDRADKTTRGGQANHGGTLEERERRARAMTVLTEHKPVCQLTKQDWQRTYDNACKVKASVKALINPPTPLNEFVTDDLDQMAGHERVTSLISAMKQIQRYANFLDLSEHLNEDDFVIIECSQPCNIRLICHYANRHPSQARRAASYSTQPRWKTVFGE
jgi:hypothetical protein